MHNIEWTIEGTTLVLRIDVSKPTVDRAPPSASGKTHLVASTGGAVPVSGGAANQPMTFSLNVMAKR